MLRRTAPIFLISLFIVACSSPRKAEAPKGQPPLALNGWLGGTAPSATSHVPERRDFPVNSSIDPCTDFYQYACSQPTAAFKLREDRSRHVFAFHDSYERLLDKKKQYLSTLLTAPASGRFAKSLRTVFQACMDESASKKEEQEAVRKWVRKISDISSRDTFLQFLGATIHSEDSSFLYFGTEANHDRPDELDLFILSGIQSLPERSYYENEELIRDWSGLLQTFFQTIGMDRAEERAQSVVQFEKAFAQTYPLPAEFRELWNKRSRITKEELLSRYPNLHLKNLLRHIPDKTHIRDFTPDNFKWLNEALENETLDTLKNVYLFKNLSKYLDDAYPAYFAKSFAFNQKHLGGPNQRPPRQERCTMLVMRHFTKELDYELLPEVFPNFPARKFIELAEKVRQSILDGIQNNNWLTPEGRQGALQKIEHARLQLVKPSNDEEWDFNPKVIYSPKTPYRNLNRLRKANNDKSIRELSKKRDRYRWGMGPLTVNAYYQAEDNKFVMPVGILQYPFYDPRLPDHVNLGAVGSVIGHELGHGIDDQGSKYDDRGELKQWMSTRDLEEFKARSVHLVELFNELGMNGQLTLGENIGDLVGVTFAYYAAFPKGVGSVQQKREFFLQYARNWCGVVRPKELERLLKIDPHSPFFARVNGQMKHQPGFQEAFGCKSPAPMVLEPGRRVQIW